VRRVWRKPRERLRVCARLRQERWTLRGLRDLLSGHTTAPEPSWFGGRCVAGKIRVVTNKWQWSDTLPEGLDVTQAVAYREVERDSPAMLGGQQYVFPDGQVWWQGLDGRWKASVHKPVDLEKSSRWERVEA